MANKTLSLGDRFAEVTVIAVAALALFAGWMFKSSVESRSVAFEAEGISAQAPSGWKQSQSGNELLRVTDLASSGFNTTYILYKKAFAADSTLESAASLWNLNRAQELTAHRVLSQQKVAVNGVEAYQIVYAYVESNPNMTHNELPSVVRGEDFIFMKDGQAVIVSYWAAADQYEVGLGAFHRFLTSVKY